MQRLATVTGLVIVLSITSALCGQSPPLATLDDLSESTGDANTNALDCNTNALLAADVLDNCASGPPPAVVVDGVNLGLTGNPNEDVLDAISRRRLSTQTLFLLAFSVDRTSVGGATAIAGTFNVTDQAAKVQAAGDLYLSTEAFDRSTGLAGGLGENNNVLVDNQGFVSGKSFQFRPLISPDTVWLPVTSSQFIIDYLQIDELNAATEGPVPNKLYYSLETGSVTLAGGSGATIFVDPDISAPGSEATFATPANLGLVDGDDVDALVVFDLNNNNVFDGTDVVLFSLTAGSPSLGTLSAGAADVLRIAAGGAPSVFAEAANLGLSVSDDIDALDIVPIASVDDVGTEIANRKIADDCCPISVFITEIMYNPNSTEPGGPNFEAFPEWVEIYNAGDSTVDISGYFLQDEDGKTEGVPEGAMLAPGEAAILTTGFMTVEEYQQAWGATVTVYPLDFWTGDNAQFPGNMQGLSNSPAATLTSRNEVLTLRSADGLIQDLANFDDTSPWPSDSPDGPSIYLTPGNIDPNLNDDGSKWARSVEGVHGAFRNTMTLHFNGVDIGSPGAVQTGLPENNPPLASSQTVLTNKVTAITITLQVTDADGGQNPEDPLTIRILSLPAAGTLTDANDGHIITQSDIDDDGFYELSGGNEVIYTPDGVFHNVATFQFAGHDTFGGGQTGNAATVTIRVQDATVIITEIMYDPNNTGPGTSEADWEWVEIYNAGSETVMLGELVDVNSGNEDNLAGFSIPPGGVRVIASTGVERTEQDFVDLWGGSASDYYFVQDNDDPPDGSPDWPALNNTGGDDLTLRDADGNLLDVVNYRRATPWPPGDSGHSIYVLPGQIDTVANDNPSTDDAPQGEANWALSVAPTDCARDVPGPDTGSPLHVPGVSSGNCAPSAVGGLSSTVTDTPVEIMLDGVDDGLPNGVLQFVITRLPEDGQLSEDGADITYTGYVLAGDTVTYERLGNFTGLDTFDFRADDTDVLSATATETVAVQDAKVVITEVMYNPQNNAPAEAYWEWVEIHNPTNQNVALSGLTDGENNFNLVDLGIDIPPQATRVIARDDNPDGSVRSQTEFRAEWGLSDDDVIWVEHDLWSELLNTPNDPGRIVRLFDIGNGLLDQVVYQNNLNGWPNDDGQSSIYLRADALTSGGNDHVDNWLLSHVDCDAGTASDDSDSVSDIGSPTDLPSSTTPDCNTNDFIDECEIASGEGNNCNGNLIPDECEGLSDPLDADCDFDVDCDDFTTYEAILGGATPCSEIAGDANCDGVVDESDRPAFLAALGGDEDGNGVPDDCEAVPVCATCAGDMTGDNAVDGDDVGAFVAVLIGGTYDPCADLTGDGMLVDGDDLDLLVDELLMDPDTGCDE